MNQALRARLSGACSAANGEFPPRAKEIDKGQSLARLADTETVEDREADVSHARRVPCPVGRTGPIRA
jgi:hypothetical protein